ncbi:MAG: hypothetical protein PVI04_10055 [Anaerolineales bacterium]|jgi:hypothetical protein
MSVKALFEGLIVDEYDQPVGVTQVGDDSFYVIDDEGFMRHVESESVDRQVLNELFAMIAGQEELISQGAMKMLGQEDIFTKAAIEASLKDVDSQIENILQTGLPEDMRAWMGMMGFRVVLDIHGDVVEIAQPTAPDDFRE